MATDMLEYRRVYIIQSCEIESMTRPCSNSLIHVKLFSFWCLILPKVVAFNIIRCVGCLFGLHCCRLIAQNLSTVSPTDLSGGWDNTWIPNHMSLYHFHLATQKKHKTHQEPPPTRSTDFPISHYTIVASCNLPSHFDMTLWTVLAKQQADIFSKHLLSSASRLGLWGRGLGGSLGGGLNGQRALGKSWGKMMVYFKGH